MPNRLIDGRDHPIKRNGLYRPFIGALITALVAFIFYRLCERCQRLISTRDIAGKGETDFICKWCDIDDK